MNKSDLKINAVANARTYYDAILNTDYALTDLLDELMDNADKNLDYNRVRDELERLIIDIAVDKNRGMA